jgi:hypothetical protein
MTTTADKPKHNGKHVIESWSDGECVRCESIDRLREMLPPFSEVLTVLRHVSASGMTRWIDLYAVIDGRVEYLTGYAAQAMGEKRDTRGNQGIEVGGCGMDMGFHLVYNLGRTLYPEGAAVPEGVRYYRNGSQEFEENGGYCLKHRWL